MRRLCVAMALMLAPVLAPAIVPAQAIAAPSTGQDYDAGPWLADLDQMRDALQEKYANLEWLSDDREVDIGALFADARKGIEGGRNDADARAAFDRLIRRMGDGHVRIDWPGLPDATTPDAADAAPVALCDRLGFDARQKGPGIAQALPGYVALPGDSSFDAGMLETGGKRLGVLRIAVFQPNGDPGLCHAALAALRISEDAPCDDGCTNRLWDAIYARMTTDFMARIDQLRSEIGRAHV